MIYDTKIYSTINDPKKDNPALKLDLNRLSDWDNNRRLRFNSEKCEAMRTTHSMDTSPNYPLGEQLQSVESVKDVGITINYDVSWGKHVSYIVNKENKV